MTTPAVAAARPPGSRWRRRGAAAVVLGLLALGGSFSWRWHEGRTERRHALEVAETSRFDAAEPLLRHVHERHPDDVEVGRALALGYLDARQFAEAEPLLDRWC